MSGADYKHCDVCGNKAFYDASLNYGESSGEDDFPAFREAGKDQYHSRDSLDYLGDWAVICHVCAKTYKTVIVPKGE